jgi:alpha,alpha-trehalose phosphorylase
VIDHPAFLIEPWCLRECRLDLDVLSQSESLFALSNGHLGLRGNLDEGEPYGIPGTYLNSVYESRPFPHGEDGYGDPESGQACINVTNGKLIRLLIDDEPFDVRHGTVLSHERCLDMRAGTLTRHFVWRSPTDSTVEVTSTRLVSLSQRSVAAIRYEVRAIDGPLRVVVQSEIVANESLPDLGGDPREPTLVESPLESEEHASDKLTAVLVHRTKRSGLRVGVAMDHEVDGPAEIRSDAESYPDTGRVTFATRLAPGETFAFTKYLAYGWSSERSRSAVHDQVVGALAAARMSGWDGLVAEQRQCLDEFWDGADVELDGDAEIQQAVRFSLFHLLQAGMRAENFPIPAKGLTGPGYDGHAFWDTEIYVLPVLTFTHPPSARDALEWRRSTLPLARARAAQLGLAGAAFPWRTIHGEECSAYWPAGTAAFHVNADIADAVVRYLDVTKDEEFVANGGLELLVETARFWRSLGHHDADGKFRIDGVTGPDEYSAIADNNVYTNLMAARNMQQAADMVVHRLPEQRLGVTVEEAASWRDAASNIFIPYDERLEVHPQSEGFTEHSRWDFEQTPQHMYPLMLHVPYFDLYRKQVVKQADLVLAMQLCPDAFTFEEKTRNFSFYEALTVRDSSLSASAQAVIAAEVGQLELAYDYLGESALIDLDDRAHNTRDGLHLASLAGTWTALIAGFGGMRASEGRLRFAPRLPSGITRLRFTIRYRESRILLTIIAGMATYQLLEGVPLLLEHHAQELYVKEEPVDVEIPPAPEDPRPTQPSGRAPLPRHGRARPTP